MFANSIVYNFLFDINLCKNKLQQILFCKNNLQIVISKKKVQTHQQITKYKFENQIWNVTLQKQNAKTNCNILLCKNKLLKQLQNITLEKTAKCFFFAKTTVWNLSNWKLKKLKKKQWKY